MSDTDRGICPECETEQALNKDRTIRKHGDCPTGLRAVEDSQPPAEQPDNDPSADDGLAVDVDGTYRWEITVSQPALYLDDPAWHAANSLLAAQHATDAGHVPTGEAPCTNVAATEDGGGLTLTYHVPIAT